MPWQPLFSTHLPELDFFVSQLFEILFNQALTDAVVEASRQRL
ncbi:MAG: hypothetical protein V4496_06025 [Pseudomonadota bacterium]